MKTYRELRQFNPDGWRVIVDQLSRYADELDSQAVSVSQLSESVRSAWPDQIGQQIATTMQRQADRYRDVARRYRTASQMLNNVNDQMIRLHDQVIKIEEVCNRTHMIIHDSGIIVPDMGYLISRGLINPDKFVLAQQALSLSRALRAVLQQATMLDQMLAQNMATLLGGVKLPDVELGPLDMTDEGILNQVKNNTQGDYGHCAFLALLLSIGAADPDFIRRHVHFDPSSQTYRVTLYDPKTGQPKTVVVDPRKIDPGAGRVQGSREITYLSVYQQAVLQEHPDIQHYNFELTQKIVRGKAAPEATTREVGFSEIRHSLSARPPAAVMVATPGAQQVDANTPFESRVAPGHAYSVVGFDSEGRIVLRNPWGEDAVAAGGIRYPAEVRMTEAEYRKFLHGVTIIDPPM